MKKLLSFAFLLISFYSSSQYANNWYIGSNVGLNFSNTPANILNNGIAQNIDNCTTISDASGNLLFYTDGMTVRDQNHAIMPNGSGLTSHFSAGQCAIIVPIPCSNKYAIFHVTEFSNPGYLKYSVVDMSLNGGLGDVVAAQKNVSLGTGWTEKLCAYYNAANGCYWVVSHKWQSNEFVAFKVDAGSIATTSVVSAIGSVHNCGTYGAAHDAMGQLTISQDGSKIVNALTCQDKYEIFDFNQNTAIITNSIGIPGNTGKAWGTAFSPNGQKLYVNTLFGSIIYQYDLSVYTYSAIVGSIQTIYNTNTGGYNFGYMELGPNGKIYIPRPNTNFISVVNTPNMAGALCNYSFTGQSTGTATSNWGTSRIAYNIPQPLALNITPSYTICRGQTAALSSTLSGGTLPYTYTWSNGSNLNATNVSPSITTVYTLQIVDNAGCQYSAMTTVYVEICEGIPTNINNNKEILIYPNPAGNEIYIKGEQINRAIILNSLGAEVKRINEIKDKINISDLPEGIYFIKLFSNDQKVYTAKLIKQD